MTEGLVTILAFAANPKEVTQLRLDEEMREIREKIRLSEARDRVRLETRWATRPDDLLQGLNEIAPQIVHFSGHGSGAQGIVLQRADGSPVTVSSQALKRLFQTMRDNVRLVFLNACYSQDQAQGILDAGVDTVVGMGAAIGDDTARIFSSAFYRALAFYRSVQEAFDQGLTAIAMESYGEVDTPRLVARQGVNAAELFLLTKVGGKVTVERAPRAASSAPRAAPPAPERTDASPPQWLIAREPLQPAAAPQAPSPSADDAVAQFIQNLGRFGVAGTWVETGGQGQMVIVGAPPQYQYREYNTLGMAIGEGTIQQTDGGLMLLGVNSFAGQLQGRMVVTGDRMDLTVFTIAGPVMSVWARANQ